MKKMVFTLVLASLLLLVACQPQGEIHEDVNGMPVPEEPIEPPVMEETEVIVEEVVEEPEEVIEEHVEEMMESSWQDITLTDVRTGEEFKVSDFRGKEVLLETFAVWCPTCRKQQEVLRDFGELPDYADQVHLSVNTDPNEDEARVVQYLSVNDFDWSYSVAPVEFTDSLVDEFGFGVVSAPSAPIIMICKDGSSRLFGGGLKKESELKEEIARGC